MPVYQKRMKQYQRGYATMSDAEHQLWRKLRGKQILGVQFYRQKPLGDYIVDFYAYKVGLGIEVDLPARRIPDDECDRLLATQGLKVLRFDDAQILNDIDAVVTEIHVAVLDRLELRCVV